MMENFIGHGQARVIGLTLAVCLLGLGGCERLKSYTDQEYLQKAKTAQSQRNLKEAVIDLKNALQKNPNNAEARWLLGEAYVTLEQGREAEKELKRAQELGINPESLKVPMGRALLLQGLYKRALDETQPGSDSSQINIARILEIQGRAQLGLGKLDEGCPLFQQSLQKDADYIPAYWGLARCAAVQGKPDEARAQLKKALRLEENNSSTWLLLGDIEHNTNHYSEAELAYTQALKYKPKGIDALLGRAVNRIKLKKLPEAEQDIAAAFNISKAHPLATHLHGVVLYKQGKYNEAKSAFETTLKSIPGYLPSILWLGLTNTVLQNYQQAADQLTQFTRAFPRAVQIQTLLAMVQARMGGKEQALEALKLLGSVKIEDPQSLSTLAQAYMLVGEGELATQYLQRVVELKPDDAGSHYNLAVGLMKKGENAGAVEQLERSLAIDPELPQAEELLIKSLIADKQYDKALQAIDEFQSKRPKDPLPHYYRGSVLSLQNNQQGARAEFLKALDVQPGYPPASHSLALMAIREGNMEQARDYYQKALDHNKDHLSSMLALYFLETRMKHPEEAKKILEKAVAAHPTEPRPISLLASNYLNSGMARKALEVSSGAAAAHPDDIGLLQVRGSAYLASGDAGNALASYKRLVQLSPNSAEAYFLLAGAHAALNDPAATREALTKALSLEPKHFGSKVVLARLNLKEGKIEEAARIGKELQQEYPKSVEGILIESDTLVSRKKLPDALRTLEQAQKTYPASYQVVFALSRVRWDMGDREGSLKGVKDWLEVHPDDLPATVHLGSAYLSLGREQEATAAFEQALKLAPSDPVILNNLAWLSRKTNPDRALEYAEKAYKIAPNNPGVIDTLGWLLVQQGKIKRGLELLQKAFELVPDLPVVQYHYAAALAKAGEKALARRELERLLSSGKKFTEEPEARALLKQL